LDEIRIEYCVNEVFVNVIEKVNVFVAQNGAVVHNGIAGEINFATYLAGMP
jgi:AP-1 complex subunit mu